MAHPKSLREVATRYLIDGKGRELAFAVLLDEFLDRFYEADAPRQTMIDEQPPKIGNERHDAYLAAVAEHLARRWGLVIPAWSDAPWREVAVPWFVGTMGQGLAELLLVESPIAFRRRGIFTEAEPLRTARMPRTN